MKLSPLLFGPDSSVGIVNEEEELLVEDDLEEANSLGAVGGGGGQVVGYTGPLGARGVGTSSALEKGFWPDDVGKEVKTGSPELDKDIKETVQAVGTPTKKLNMVKLLWSEDDVNSPVKTDSEALHEDASQSQVPEGITSIDDYIDQFDTIPSKEVLIQLFELEQKNKPNFWFKRVNFGNKNKLAIICGYNTKRNNYGDPTPSYIFEFDGSEFTRYDIRDWFDSALRGDTSEYFDVDFEEQENKEFWDSPVPLYHATPGENLKPILTNGLNPQDKTRGLTNKGVGHAVFTSMDPEKIDSYTGRDGGIVEIDTQAMKQDGYTPHISSEPEILENRIAGALAHAIGLDFEGEYSDAGMDEETVIVHGPIPAKYISLLDSRSPVDEIIAEPKRTNAKDMLQLDIKPDGGIKNIITVYNQATEEEKDFWNEWYHHAQKDVQELAEEYKIDFILMAAVVATLSPGSRWNSNLLAAKRLIASANNPEAKINAYPRQIETAKKILETGDVSLVSGPKVSVFFKSLADPESTKKHIVLDGHAMNIWRGVKTPLKGLQIPNKTDRAKMVEDYQQAASKLGVSVQALQATTWYVWKYMPKSHDLVVPTSAHPRRSEEFKPSNVFGKDAEMQAESSNKIDIYAIIQEETKDLMSKMGYTFVGNNYRLGSDTYIQKDDPSPASSKKYIDMSNKNINKGKPGPQKDTLHDPPAVGVSLPKKMKG